MDSEIKLAILELEKLTGFKGSRSDFTYNFNKFLEKKDINAGDGVKICKKILKEIEKDPIFDIEKRLDDLCDEYYLKRHNGFCVKCHGKLIKNANYCTFCGKKIK